MESDTAREISPLDVFAGIRDLPAAAEGRVGIFASRMRSRWIMVEFPQQALGALGGQVLQKCCLFVGHVRNPFILLRCSHLNMENDGTAMLIGHSSYADTAGLETGRLLFTISVDFVTTLKYSAAFDGGYSSEDSRPDSPINGGFFNF